MAPPRPSVSGLCDNMKDYGVATGSKSKVGPGRYCSPRNRMPFTSTAGFTFASVDVASIICQALLRGAGVAADPGQPQADHSHEPGRGQPRRHPRGELRRPGRAWQICFSRRPTRFESSFLELELNSIL